MKVINRNGFFSPPSSKRNLAPSLSDQELIKLINNLSSVIKKYYVSTKASLSSPLNQIPISPCLAASSIVILQIIYSFLCQLLALLYKHTVALTYHV